MRLAPDVTFAAGCYRLQRRLGTGGMASAWLHATSASGHVAVKVIADTLADNERWLTRSGARLAPPAAMALGELTIVDVREDHERAVMDRRFAAHRAGCRAARTAGYPGRSVADVARVLA